jgi:hypothetical protein
MRQDRMTRTRRPRRDRSRSRPSLRLSTPRGGPDPELDEELLQRIERLLVAEQPRDARA